MSPLVPCPVLLPNGHVWHVWLMSCRSRAWSVLTADCSRSRAPVTIARPSSNCIMLFDIYFMVELGIDNAITRKGFAKNQRLLFVVTQYWTQSHSYNWVENTGNWFVRRGPRETKMAALKHGSRKFYDIPRQEYSRPKGADRLHAKQSVEELLRYIDESCVGKETTFSGPFGARKGQRWAGRVVCICVVVECCPLITNRKGEVYLPRPLISVTSVSRSTRLSRFLNELFF